MGLNERKKPSHATVPLRLTGVRAKLQSTDFLDIQSKQNSLFPIFWDQRGSNQFNPQTLGTKERQTCLF